MYTIPDKAKNGKIFPVLLLLLILLSFLLLSYVSLRVFMDYPYSMDEYNYLYQARIFSAGRYYLDFDKRYTPFVEKYMIINGSRLFSKYPPGFPLVLSTGVLAGSPGLVNPLLSILSLAIVYLTASELVGRLGAILSVALMASNDYFIGYGASYFSQPLSLMLTSLILFFYVRYAKRQSKQYLLLIGLASGFLLAVRPIDAFCIMAPASCLLLIDGWRTRKLAQHACWVLPFFILLVICVLYNYSLAGRLALTSYPATTFASCNSTLQCNSLVRKAYPAITLEMLIIVPGADTTYENILLVLGAYMTSFKEFTLTGLYKYFLVKSSFFLPLMSAAGFFLAPRNIKCLLAGNFALLVMLYVLHPSIGWPQYGARYYYSGLTSVVLLASYVLSSAVSSRRRRIVLAAVGLIMLVQLACVYTSLSEYAGRFRVVSSVWKDIEESCPEKSFVLLHPYNFSKTNEFLRHEDFKRNPFLNGSRLLTTYGYKITSVMKNHTDYSVCDYEFKTP